MAAAGDLSNFDQVTHSSCRSEASGTESANYQMCGCWECDKSDWNEAVLCFSPNFFVVEVDVHCPTQLHIPWLNRILDEHFSCCSGSPITAGSSTAPQLHLLQLLLPNWICLAAGPRLHLLSCWSSIAYLLQLLLPAFFSLWLCTCISFEAIPFAAREKGFGKDVLTQPAAGH